jgi:hypothetical protein
VPHLAASWVLAAVLVAAAVAKLAAPADSRAALATFGIARAGAQWAVWGLVVALELAFAAGVAAGLDAAAWGAAALLAVFAAASALALARGRAGAPCACFGARSRLSARSLARDVALAAAFVALPFLPEGHVSTDAWLAAGLGLALAAVAALAVAVLALAREVGMLRLAVGSQGALEIPEEGPPLGDRCALADRIPVTPQTRLALAVFASEGCALCRAAAPSVELLAREAWLAVEVFDEQADAGAWSEAGVPGSPYAVALDPLTGVALAKGTFNGLAQLESVLSAAERRALEAAHA